MSSHAMVRTRRTKLEGKRLGKAYRGRLSAGFDLVLRWLSYRDPELLGSLNEGSVDSTFLDQLLAEVVSECWELQLSFSLIKHSILGVQTKFRFGTRAYPARLGLHWYVGGSQGTSKQKPD